MIPARGALLYLDYMWKLSNDIFDSRNPGANNNNSALNLPPLTGKYIV